MRVLACYNGSSLRPETYRSLVKYVPVGSLEMVNVSGNISNYWRQFRARWLGEFDLMTVEQDNVITAEMIPSFSMCDEPWCVYAYEGPPHMEGELMDTALGCTRFTAALQKAVPAKEISESDYFSWQFIDYRLSVVLQQKGYRPHVHGEVQHLHDYDKEPIQAALGQNLIRMAIAKGVTEAAEEGVAARKVHPAHPWRDPRADS